VGISITPIFISIWLFLTHVFVFFSIAPYPWKGCTPRDIGIIIVASCHTSIKLDWYWPMEVNDPCWVIRGTLVCRTSSHSSEGSYTGSKQVCW
jgi:hypothetical protein